MEESVLLDPHAGRCVTLSRRTQFSAAHLYKQKKFSEPENRETFGACFTEHGHGHNFVLEAFYVGRIQSDTGIVANLSDVDRALRECVAPMEHRHLNFEIPFFADLIPTTENVARFCFERLLAAPFRDMVLERVRLYECEDIWSDWLDPEASLGRAVDLDLKRALSLSLGREQLPTSGDGLWSIEQTVFAQHSLNRPDLNTDENERLYGACYRHHGHDYRARATFRGGFDAHTGLFVDRERATDAFEREIIRPFQGRNLNKMMANTSCEALACEWFDRLSRALEGTPLAGKLDEVSIQETRKNWFARSRRFLDADKKAIGAQGA